jgi:hypothetical protein
VDFGQAGAEAQPKKNGPMSRREKIAWVLFGAASVQLAFLHPYIILVRGERTNLFSGLLCLVALSGALFLGKKNGLRFKSPEVLFSLVLAALAVVSGLLSITPLSTSFRVFSLLASGLGGFWCARLLLNTPDGQRRFEVLALFLLAGVILLSFTGYFLSSNIDMVFRTKNTHPLANTIMLLSFAPIVLLFSPSRPRKLLGLGLLLAGYVILCVSERLSVVFIPMVACLLWALFGVLRWRYLLLTLIATGLITGYYSHQLLWFKLSKEYPYYRIENLPFSWSIARQHPIFGIGVRAPREEFLKDYNPRYPYVSKEKFTQDIREIVSADNIFVTFMTGLGIPFLIIYSIALILLLIRLLGITFKPPPGLAYPPLALLLPLAMALMHFQLYDGLLFAQNSWFFHILLGLIPVPAHKMEESGICEKAQLIGT